MVEGVGLPHAQARAERARGDGRELGDHVALRRGLDGRVGGGGPLRVFWGVWRWGGGARASGWGRRMQGSNSSPVTNRAPTGHPPPSTRPAAAGPQLPAPPPLAPRRPAARRAAGRTCMCPVYLPMSGRHITTRWGVMDSILSMSSAKLSSLRTYHVLMRVLVVSVIWGRAGRGARGAGGGPVWLGWGVPARFHGQRPGRAGGRVGGAGRASGPSPADRGR